MQLGAVEEIGWAGGGAAVLITALLCRFLIYLLRENGEFMVRLDALEATAASARTHRLPRSLTAGEPAPPFSLPDLDGKTVTLDHLCADGKPVVLLFADPNNPFCHLMWPEVARWEQAYGDRLTLAVISRGTAKTNRAVAELGLNRVLLQRDEEVFAVYGLYATPSALVVRPDGTVGHALVLGVEPIVLMIAQTMRSAT